MKYYCYITICCLNNYKNILNLIYKYLNKLDIDEFRIVIYSDNKSDFNNLDLFKDTRTKIIKYFNENQGNTFEYYTFEELINDSKKENFNFFYLHTTGINNKDYQLNLNYIEYLLYYHINYNELIKIKLKMYDVIGVNIYRFPYLHFKGNFFHSSSEFIKTLSIDDNIIKLNKFILSNTDNILSLNNCYLNDIINSKLYFNLIDLNEINKINKFIIYFSLCLINNWFEIFNNIYNKLYEYDLYHHILEIRLVIINYNEKLINNCKLLNDPKIKIIKKIDNKLGKSSEVFCLNELLNFAKNTNINYNILYLHSKGVSNEYQDNSILGNNVKKWVNIMIHYLFNKYDTLISEKLKYYDTIGINLLENPKIHYSGNFWWTNTKYVKNLKNCSYNYLDAEFWICSEKGKFLSLKKYENSMYFTNSYEIGNIEYFHIMNDFKNKIYYGTNNKKIDITNIILKTCKKDNKIIIPKDDSIRAFYFGDPEFGTLKKIFINNKSYVNEVILDLNGNICG